ncbi:basic phospholipase A2 Ceg-N6-like [Podarcis raffonei]|uniref:basic phospholipase A2 Ceg-N6-like n=1 Tax=Podarcis raffonei TaxID=65483 RepID=UPI0023291E4E|nr:basic phospholipase A2 Ceg-N6-like [Podarcis raffonei]
MIKQMTGKNAIPDYMAYGCYCGWGGSGMPKDQTDWCCRNHDCCYKRVDEQGCDSKLATYSYTYKSGNVICGNEPWYWAMIPGTSIQCERLTCECDQKFVQCLKKNLKTYQKKYTYFPNFLCFGHPPLCPVEPRMRWSKEAVGGGSLHGIQNSVPVLHFPKEDLDRNAAATSKSSLLSTLQRFLQQKNQHTSSARHFPA